MAAGQAAGLCGLVNRSSRPASCQKLALTGRRASRTKGRARERRQRRVPPLLPDFCAASRLSAVGASGRRRRPNRPGLRWRWSQRFLNGLAHGGAARTVRKGHAVGAGLAVNKGHIAHLEHLHFQPAALAMQPATQGWDQTRPVCPPDRPGALHRPNGVVRIRLIVRARC